MEIPGGDTKKSVSNAKYETTNVKNNISIKVIIKSYFCKK